MRSVRQALLRALASIAATFRHDLAGCCDCGAAGAHTITFEPETGFPWTRCEACTDRLFDDDDMVAHLAEDGVTWTYLPGAPVFNNRAIDEQWDDLRAHSMPFFPPVDPSSDLLAGLFE